MFECVCVCVCVPEWGSLTTLTQDLQARRAGGWEKNKGLSYIPCFAPRGPQAPTPGRCLTPYGQRPDPWALLQAQVAALQQNHSPARLEVDEQRLELQQEVDRLRSAQVQTERTLEARERAHRQRVRGLEEQVLRPGGLWPFPRGRQQRQDSPFRRLGQDGSVELGEGGGGRGGGEEEEEVGAGRGLAVTSWV